MTLFQLAKLSCRPTRSYRRHSGAYNRSCFQQREKEKT
ncbi:hypothetical protein UUU_16790 [Klebsiella pneumoniae subsp. pneumoniae DSM 30104 = JCM 1662 = NBRC 14940]|nr:hypothetical protein UUU_16790 [Klebsiella pneumoniae subsp. pneumoniae DSM 30104 = JCM 1662 = NBRC 14940]